MATGVLINLGKDFSDLGIGHIDSALIAPNFTILNMLHVDFVPVDEFAEGKRPGQELNISLLSQLL